MFVGEGPARQEERYGRPFAGDTGSELDYYYLPLSGLCRTRVYVTNVRHCANAGYENPTPEQAWDCACCHLSRELDSVRPEVVVLLGSVACSLLPDINLELDHGIPREASLFGWTGVVIPFYHPSAGLHEQRYMLPLREDFTLLRRILLDGPGSVIPSNRHPEPDYTLIETGDQLLASFSSDLSSSSHTPSRVRMGMDTEFTPDGRVYMISWSLQPGSGRVVLASNGPVVRLLSRSIADLRPLVYLHNALADLDQLSSAGISGFDYEDTMLGAYILGDLPQGLKTLAWRLFGVRMQSFEDLVLPYSRQVVLDWLAALSLRLNEAAYIVRQPKSGRGKARTAPNPEAPPIIRSCASKVGKLFTDMLSGKTCDPWKRWQGWTLGERDLISSIFGSIPEPSISHVPVSVSAYYSCADADMTLRLGLQMGCMMRRLRKQVSLF
jgi:uracil-DNA glycosylase family 4